MTAQSLRKLQVYLHLVPIFGIIFSLWFLYGKSSLVIEDPKEATVKAASRLSVMLGLVCVGAIACLYAGAHSQTSQINHLRFLFASSFVGSGYCLLSLALMFRVAKDRSIRLPGLSQLSRRLP